MPLLLQKKVSRCGMRSDARCKGEEKGLSHGCAMFVKFCRAHATRYLLCCQFAANP